MTAQPSTATSPSDLHTFDAHEDESPSLRRFSGTSTQGDFKEALQRAIGAARNGLETELVAWTLHLVRGVNGGIAGRDELTVHIAARVPAHRGAAPGAGSA